MSRRDKRPADAASPPTDEPSRALRQRSVQAAVARRQQADAMFPEKAAPSPEQIEAMSPEARQQILRQLHARQIELETENEELRRTQVELGAWHARYFDFYDLAPVGYVSVSEQGLILEANLTTANLLGVSRAALINQPINRFILREDQDIFYLLRKQLFQSGHAQACELRIVKQGGAPFWARLEAVAGEDTGAPMFRTVLTDISDRKRAEAARASLEAQLRESQKMEAIGTLAGGIAHDFNNIIATILGNTKLVREDLSANPLALESLEEIRKAGTRGRDLVQQILAFSRRQPADRKPIALIPVIEECARLLRATLPSRLVLKVHCDAGVPRVLAAASQIQQVVINLATNAMQAMHPNPGRIGIRLDTVMLDAALADAYPALHALHARHPGRTVRLEVYDDGPGMDAVTLSRIFEPFFTTKPVDVGTGLGLWVVHGIVQTHESAIAVESQPGKGTTFTIYLPPAEAEAVAPEPEQRAAATPKALSLYGGPRVLYLDDDDALVFLVKRLLGRRGYRVSAHTDQREALDALRADPASFDLVVTDYSMPGMSGLDVAREVRAIRADLPVAVASGFIDETLREQADETGVRELIFKETAVEDFCEVVERLILAAAAASASEG